MTRVIQGNRNYYLILGQTELLATLRSTLKVLVVLARSDWLDVVNYSDSR